MAILAEKWSKANILLTYLLFLNAAFRRLNTSRDGLFQMIKMVKSDVEQ